MRLTDIAKASGLSLPTAARLLNALAAEQMVEVHDDGRTWKLGQELVFLGLSAARQLPLIRLAAPHLDALAQRTGDATFLSVRSGDDSICVYRAVGSHPQQAYTTHIGSRRPLGVGGGGLTLLAGLPTADIDAILQRNAAKLSGYRHVDAVIIRSDITAALTQGYGYARNHLSGGVHAIGLPVSMPSGEVIAAVSVSASAERLRAPRREQVARWLRGTAALIARDLETPGVEE